MRTAFPLLCVALLAALVAGCGGSPSSSRSQRQGERGDGPARAATAPAGSSAQTCDTFAVDAKALRATSVACRQARQLMFGWQRSHACSLPAGASRNACTVRSYRCLGAAADRGTAVSCATGGRSVAFVARHS